jgi:hypothetical protein
MCYASRTMKVVLARPLLDYSKPFADQADALDAFCRSVARALQQPTPDELEGMSNEEYAEALIQAWARYGVR